MTALGVPMRFFLPAANSRAEADAVIESIAKFIGFPLPERRIFRLAFSHNGEDYDVEIGKPAPRYYNEGSSPVVAILVAESGSPYAICLANRGVLRGSPIYASKESVSEIEYFDVEGNELTRPV
jgi:hypothetical protein